MIIKNVKVFTEDKTFEPGAIGIENGILRIICLTAERLLTEKAVMQFLD